MSTLQIAIPIQSPFTLGGSSWCKQNKSSPNLYLIKFIPTLLQIPNVLKPRLNVLLYSQLNENYKVLSL
jgi:hypothetical protein